MATVDLSHLEVFTAVVEERHFSRAARRLARTQAAVSQTIKKLEHELGTALLDRNAKGVIPTAAVCSTTMRDACSTSATKRRRRCVNWTN